MKPINSSIVPVYKNTGTVYKVLNLYPPPICKTETTVPRTHEYYCHKSEQMNLYFLHTNRNKLSQEPPVTTLSPLQLATPRHCTSFQLSVYSNTFGSRESLGREAAAFLLRWRGEFDGLQGCGCGLGAQFV